MFDNTHANTHLKLRLVLMVFGQISPAVWLSEIHFALHRTQAIVFDGFAIFGGCSANNLSKEKVALAVSIVSISVLGNRIHLFKPFFVIGYRKHTNASRFKYLFRLKSGNVACLEI